MSTVTQHQQPMHQPPVQARPTAIQSDDHVARFHPTESAPPWLVSVIVHLLAIILLAVVYLDRPAAPGAGIPLNSQLVGTEDEMDLFKLGGMDAASDEEVSIETEIVESPLAELELTEVDLADLLASQPSVNDSLASMAASSGSGSGVAGSGKGQTSFYGLGGSGSRFVYLFDRSESMNARIAHYSEGYIVSEVTPLTAAKKELWESLRSLSDDLAFQIIFYNHFPIVFGSDETKPHMFKATEENKARAHEFIEAIPGDGTTKHILALEAALKLNPDVIFLLTDGEYKDDPSQRDVRKIASMCNRKGVVVNVIHLVPKPRPNTTLIELAERTGGQHQFIEP